MHFLVDFQHISKVIMLPQSNREVDMKLLSVLRKKVYHLFFVSLMIIGFTLIITSFTVGNNTSAQDLCNYFTPCDCFTISVGCTRGCSPKQRCIYEQGGCTDRRCCGGTMMAPCSYTYCSSICAL